MPAAFRPQGAKQTPCRPFPHNFILVLLASLPCISLLYKPLHPYLNTIQRCKDSTFFSNIMKILTIKTIPTSPAMGSDTPRTPSAMPRNVERKHPGKRRQAAGVTSPVGQKADGCSRQHAGRISRKHFKIINQLKKKLYFCNF